MHVPTLETERLVIREFRMDDLEAIHRILDVELAPAGTPEEEAARLEARRDWLRWTVASYAELAKLHQPPFADRAIELKEDGTVIGTCGYAPVLLPLGKLPSYRSAAGASPDLNMAAVGLYWALSPRYQGRGYATEAGHALLEYGFNELRLARIVANTDYDNLPSQRVMERLGMRLERNPDLEPPWFQIVAVIDNPQP